MEQIYNQEYIRSIVNSIYSIQGLRIEIGNRILANMRTKITGEASPSTVVLEEELGFSLKEICLEYKKISNFMIQENITLQKYFKTNQGIITQDIEYALVDTYMNMVESEDNLVKQLAKVLKKYPIYTEFLSNTKGCGTLMSAVIISYFDPHKARHASSFFRYAGLDVTVVEKEIDGEIALIGEGTGKKHAKYNKIEYIDANGEVQTKAGLSYNPFLKSKLMGVLAASFLMTGSKDKYAQTYRDIKFRYQNMPKHQNKSPKHIDTMARRYMVKSFLTDLWVEWRTVEGLEVSEPYAVAKLELNPHGSDPSVEQLTL